MDDLIYTYDSGNKLLRVEDIGNDTYGFKDDAVAVPDNSNDYSYDANGNMLSDTNKWITSISYNYLNLPEQVTISGENILYIYDAAGIKQQKTAAGTTTQYAGSYIYENSSLKFANHAEGYIEPDGAGGYNYVYQYKDHLGNVRLSYADANNDGLVDVNEIVEESNYYPFGLKHRGYNDVVNGMPNKFLTYNGKEYEETLGLNVYEMDVRSYDPAIARFTSIDPVTHFDYSTYSAFDNNPIYWADPSGANAQSFIMDLFNRSGSGKTKWTNNNDGTFSSDTGQTVNCGDCILKGGSYDGQKYSDIKTGRVSRWYKLSVHSRDKEVQDQESADDYLEKYQVQLQKGSAKLKFYAAILGVSPARLLKEIGKGKTTLKKIFEAAKNIARKGGTISSKGLLSLGGFVLGVQLYMAGAENDRVLSLVNQIENNEKFEDSNKIIIITDVRALRYGSTTVKPYYSGDDGTFLGQIHY